MRERSDRRPGDSTGIVGQYRGVLFTFLLGVVLLGGLAAGAAAIDDGGTGAPLAAAISGDQASEPTAVDSCRIIDEAGEYELVSDVESDGGVCLHVRSDDVDIDGNGHAIRGTGNSSDGSVGLLVFNGSDDGLERHGSGLENVTVRDVTVSDHAHGVRLGQIVGDGPTVTVENVTATDNGDGVVMFGAGESSLTDVTATGSERSGVVVWETTYLSVADVTVSDNGVNGLVLDQSVLESDVSGVTATDNGRHGVVVNSGSVDNELTDAYLANNERAGITFSDSQGTTLENATVENNGGPGVHSDFGLDDSVEDVRVADNAVAYDSSDDQPRYGVLADDFSLASDVVASFGTNVSSLDDDAAVPELRENETAVGPAVNLTVDQGGVEADTTLTFPYDVDAVDDGDDLGVWVYADGTWEQTSDVTVDSDAETVTATVDRGGVVVPVVTDDESGSDDSPSAPEDLPSPGENSTVTAEVTIDGTDYDCTFDVTGVDADDVGPSAEYDVAGTCSPAGE